jgi:5'-nucleotidase
MWQWWNESHADMINSGITKQLLNQICQERPLVFRDQINNFEKTLKQFRIPMVIMSASSGYMIQRYLEQAGLFADNVDILANWYEFDSDGKMIGAKEPVIHSLNKYEITLKDYPVFDQIKNRRNVILMGDNIDDIGMVEGFDYDNLIKIGFLNENMTERLDDFKKNFDVIILNDGGMDLVNNILKKILNKNQ